MYLAQPRPLANRADPAVSGAPVETLAITTTQDRSVAAFPHGKVDSSGRAGYEWDDGGLVALADDAKRPVAPLAPEVLDIGGARLADSKTVQPQQYGKGGVITVIALGGEEEYAQLRAVKTSSVARVHLRTPDVLGRVGGDPAVDVSKAVEATYVDSRRSIVEAASPRSSRKLRYSSTCGRVASSTPRSMSEAHWKYPRRS